MAKKHKDKKKGPGGVFSFFSPEAIQPPRAICKDQGRSHAGSEDQAHHQHARAGTDDCHSCEIREEYRSITPIRSPRQPGEDPLRSRSFKITCLFGHAIHVLGATKDLKGVSPRITW